jgi:hypothetical protein
MCPRTEDRIALLRQALTSRDAWQVAAALKYVAEKLDTSTARR